MDQPGIGFGIIKFDTARGSVNRKLIPPVA